MSASMSDIDRYLQSLETEDAYRFVRTIKTSEFEVTQLVTRSFASKRAECEFYAPYVHYLEQGTCATPSSTTHQALPQCDVEQASRDVRAQSVDESDTQISADTRKQHGANANIKLNANAPTQVQPALNNQVFSNRFVRKLIIRESPLGDVYEKLFAAQHKQDRCAYTPYLPFIFECYRNDSHRVVIMQVIDGPNLEQFMRALPFEVRVQQAQKLLPSLCEAARELHEFSDHPIIHRDISPDNIIVCHDAAFLIDFGVAREYKENATHDTVCFGTRIYAAPEQFGYQQSSIRSDVYGLGMVLAYMLKGSDISAVDVSMNFECLDSLFARAHKRDMGKRLISVIAKAVAFDPKLRFTNPLEFLKAFQAACSGASSGVVIPGGAGDGTCDVVIPGGAGDGTCDVVIPGGAGDATCDGVSGFAGSSTCAGSDVTGAAGAGADAGSGVAGAAGAAGVADAAGAGADAGSGAVGADGAATSACATCASSAKAGVVASSTLGASSANRARHWFDHPRVAVRVVCMVWNVCVFLTWGFFSWAAICSGTISYLSEDVQREVINRVLLAGMLPLCFTIWGACLMFKPRWFYAFRWFRHWRWWWNGIVAFLAFVVLVTYAIISYHA